MWKFPTFDIVFGNAIFKSKIPSIYVGLDINTTPFSADQICPWFEITLFISSYKFCVCNLSGLNAFATGVPGTHRL
jgi:hypothetical protein